MSASQLLQHLYSIDTSSPDFSRLLYGLIRQDEEEKYLSSLKGPELAKLVDFLDDVRALPLTFWSVNEIDSAGSECHSHYRRCFPAMFTKTTGHLWPPYDPTVLVHGIGGDHKSW